MERIASFTVDHTVLQPGMYLSRRDGNVVTYDLRFKRPNTGDLLSNAEMHSAEHLFATLLRNSEEKDAVIYFGPMGCQTGFYLLVDGAQLSHAQTIALMQKVCREGMAYTGEMPGKSAVECGNYRNLDIELAKGLCAFYYDIIRDWTEEKLAY
jgi:S-ribosylhomocysteine lyase